MSETTEAPIEHKIADRQFTSSRSLGALADALAKAQGDIEGAKKDANNPFFHSKYADLASVWEACRQPLSKNGLAVIQLPGSNGQGLFVDTILTHASGEWISSRLYVKPGYTSREGEFVALSDPQALGSAITYGRRYGLQAIVGIAPEDDDGNAASAVEKRQDHREGAAAGNASAPVVGTHIHFGKNKGKAIVDLETRSLAGYRKIFEEKVAGGKKLSDADTALYEAVKAEIEKRKEASPTPKPEDENQDEMPMFNGENHKALAMRIIKEGIPVEDFLAAMIEAKQLPARATNFAKMTEETATKFVEDIENTVEIAKGWIERKKAA